MILQIVLQLFCVALAVKAYFDKNNNGSRKFWFWFCCGFLFQLSRRAMYLLHIEGIHLPHGKFITFIIIPTCVSVCYAIAMVKVFLYRNERNKVVAQLAHERNVSMKKLRELTERISNGNR